MQPTSSTPKFVRFAVMLGIVIALNLFFVVARELVLPQPKFENYCPSMLQPAATKEACVLQDGVWVETPGDPKVSGATKPEIHGYCDHYQKCQPLFDEANKQYQMYAFILMVGLGLLSLIAGVIPMGSSIVSSGLSYGGVLTLIIAAGGYWETAGSFLKLGMSLIALAVLIYLGAKRFRD